MSQDQTVTLPIVKQVLIDAPVAKVWKAITDKEDMKQWYFKIAEFKPVVGFEFQFYGEGSKGEKYLHLCRITEVVPMEKLQYTWRYDGLDGDSLVTFELIDENGKTRLRLTHEGLDSFPKITEDFGKESFNKGWTYLIETSIKEFAEK